MHEVGYERSGIKRIALLYFFICVVPVSTTMESLTELLQWMFDAIKETLYMDPQRSPLNLHFVSDEVQV